MNDFNDNINEVLDLQDVDPDTLGGDFEIPDDLSEYEEDTSISMAVAALNIGGGLSIVDNLTNINYSKRNNPKKYLVIHYTGGSVDNGSAAKANTNYFKSVNRGASAHLFVDMNPIVYRCVPEDYVSWHCGTTGTYYHSSCRNSNSIGIEVCSYMENGVFKFKNETLQNAIALAKYIVNKYNIPRSNVVMHWHVTHKLCAAPFITNGKPNERWENFLDSVFGDDVYAPIDVVPLNKTGKVVNINSELNFRSGPGFNYAIIGSFKLGDILNITGENGDWYMVDNKGFVSKDYVEIITNHWCDSIRDDLLSKNIITNKDEWSKYDEPITKGLAVQLISNIIRDNTNKEYKNNTHWASKALNNLVNKGIISEPSQWENNLNDYISNALYMTLILNLTGGVLDKYKNRNVDHWGRNSLDSLCDKEIINTPEEWTDFEGTVRKDKALAIIHKAYKYINK